MSPRTQAVVDYVSRIPSETLPLLQDSILSVPHSEQGLPDLVELLSSVFELNGIGTTDKFNSLLRKTQERRMAEKQQSRKEKSFLGKFFGYQRVENTKPFYRLLTGCKSIWKAIKNLHSI